MFSRRNFLGLTGATVAAIPLAALAQSTPVVPEPIQEPVIEPLKPIPPPFTRKIITGIPSLDLELPDGLGVGMHLIYGQAHSGTTTLLRTFVRANRCPAASHEELGGFAADILVFGERHGEVLETVFEEIKELSRNYVPLGGGYCGSGQRHIAREITRLSKEAGVVTVLTRRHNRPASPTEWSGIPSPCFFATSICCMEKHPLTTDFTVYMLKNRDGKRANARVRLPSCAPLLSRSHVTFSEIT